MGPLGDMAERRSSSRNPEVAHLFLVAIGSLGKLGTWLELLTFRRWVPGIPSVEALLGIAVGRLGSATAHSLLPIMRPTKCNHALYTLHNRHLAGCWGDP